jgi:hypothetical protein
MTRLNGKKRSGARPAHGPHGIQRHPLAILLAAGLALLLAGGPAVLSAQGRIGAEVQVTLISPGTLSGELIGVNADKMVLQVGPRERTIAIRDIASVRIFRESLTALSMVVGGVAGGFIGYAIGKKKGPEDPNNPSSSQWVGAGAGAVAGGGLGYLVGRLISHDKVYEFQGVSQEKIAAAIRDLSKKARVPDYK